MANIKEELENNTDDQKRQEFDKFAQMCEKHEQSLENL